MPEQEVSSPDGRKWRITTGRSKSNLQETRNEPLFWAHLIVTILIVLLLILLLKIDWGPILEIFIPVATIIVILGALGVSFRGEVFADTDGPPKEHRRWTLTKRFHRDKAIQDIADAIRAGNLTAQPEGTLLDQI